MSTRMTQTRSKAQCEAMAAWPVVSRNLAADKWQARFDAWRERMDLGEASAALELERRLSERRKAREARKAAK